LVVVMAAFFIFPWAKLVRNDRQIKKWTTSKLLHH
jgi:hypothetical protein